MTARLDLRDPYGSDGHQRIEGLDPKACLDLLLKISNCKSVSQDNIASAKAIVEQVGYHALAITVAGSLISRRLYTLSEYSTVLGQKTKELLISQPKQAKSTYGTVHATFEVSAKRLQQSDEPAAAHALELLGILAFLDRMDVSEDVFTRAWAFSETIKDRGGVRPGRESDSIRSLSLWHCETASISAWTTPEDIEPFRKARACLAELALISCDPETRMISMHPLLHQWAKERLTSDEHAEAWVVTATTLALSSGENHGRVDFTPRLQRHRETCYQAFHEGWYSCFPILEVCRVFYFFAWQLYRTHSAQTVAICTCLEDAILGKCDEDHLNANALSVLLLKGVYLDQKGDAIETFEKVLRRREDTLPAGHPDILAAQFSLGSAHSGAKQIERARQLLEEVVSIEEKLLSGDDPSLLASQHELATVYTNAGQTAKAIEILQNIVRVKKANSPQDHPELLTSHYNLACAYSESGRLKLAIPLLEHVVDIQKKALPRSSQARFISEHELIICYQNNGQLPEAKGLLEGIEADAHLLSARDRTKLQELWNSQRFEASREHEKAGELLDAIGLLEEVVENQRHDPVETPITLPCMITLSRQYLKNGQYGKARDLSQQVIMHEGALSKDWRHNEFRDMKVALDEFGQTGNVPKWLFEENPTDPGVPTTIR